MKQHNLDNREYNFYVYSVAQDKVISGNEYRNDAKDALKEFNSSGYLGDLKIYTRRFLMGMGINTNTASAWGTDMEEHLPEYEVKQNFTWGEIATHYGIDLRVKLTILEKRNLVKWLKEHGSKV